MIVSELLKYSKRQYNPEKNIYEIKVSGQILDNSISPIINVNLFKNYPLKDKYFFSPINHPKYSIVNITNIFFIQSLMTTN